MFGKRNRNIKLFAVLFAFVNFCIFEYSENIFGLFVLAVLDFFVIVYFFKFIFKTEQKYIDELHKFKLTTENASDHIVITDPDGFIIFANKSVERITGFKPSEVMGKKAGSKELWGGLMDDEFYKKLWRTIKLEKKIFSGDITNRRKNGEKYEALASISPVLDEKGDVIYYMGIERDITKEKNIDKAKTEFVSLASHQLRSPLTSINWCLEIVLSEDLGKINKKQKKYLQDALDSNKRMVTLVNTLLNVSQLDLGTLMMETENVDINGIAQDVIEELNPIILEKKINLETLYDKNILKFSADKKLLRMIFQNLLSNAIKYTPSDGNVKLEITKEKENNLLIKVSDTGIGIPENQKEKMFSKMFRADNASESGNEGTGLGLYIIKSIVDQSGGNIWFESKQNEGTTFYLTFPMSGMKKNISKQN